MIETGIELTLPKLTVKAVAERLGVSIVAIYNNIESLDALKTEVSEAILRRWTLPMPDNEDSIEQSLATLADGLKDLVHDNPGIAEYLAHLDATSPALTRMNKVQKKYAELYGLSPKQTGWVVVTVVEHSIALAELVHVPAGRARNANSEALKNPDLDFVAQTVDDKARTEDDYWAWSMRAVIVGAVSLINDPQFDDV